MEEMEDKIEVSTLQDAHVVDITDVAGTVEGKVNEAYVTDDEKLNIETNDANIGNITDLEDGRIAEDIEPNADNIGTSTELKDDNIGEDIEPNADNIGKVTELKDDIIAEDIEPNADDTGKVTELEDDDTPENIEPNACNIGKTTELEDSHTDEDNANSIAAKATAPNEVDDTVESNNRPKELTAVDETSKPESDIIQQEETDVPGDIHLEDIIDSHDAPVEETIEIDDSNVEEMLVKIEENSAVANKPSPIDNNYKARLEEDLQQGYGNYVPLELEHIETYAGNTYSAEEVENNMLDDKKRTTMLLVTWLLMCEVDFPSDIFVILLKTPVLKTMMSTLTKEQLQLGREMYSQIRGDKQVAVQDWCTNVSFLLRKYKKREEQFQKFSTVAWF